MADETFPTPVLEAPGEKGMLALKSEPHQSYSSAVWAWAMPFNLLVPRVSHLSNRGNSHFALEGGGRSNKIHGKFLAEHLAYGQRVFPLKSFSTCVMDLHISRQLWMSFYFLRYQGTYIDILYGAHTLENVKIQLCPDAEQVAQTFLHTPFHTEPQCLQVINAERRLTVGHPNAS